MIWLLLGCSGDKVNVEPSSEPIPSDCLTNEEYYSDWIDPVFQQNCVACHSSEGIASTTRMVLSDDVDLNFETVSALAEVMENERYLLLTKPTNTHVNGHSGGQPIAPDSVEYDQLELFVGRINGLAGECDTDVDLTTTDSLEECGDDVVPKRILRRLSHVEYDNTIQDLFGLTNTWATSFASDNVSHGYDNNAHALQMSPLLLDQYSNAADEIASSVIAQGLQNYVTCPSLNRGCAETFLQTKGTEIFRRPLSEQDVDGYLELYDLAADDGFDIGMTWVLSSLLQSPHFLYRSELGVRQEDDSFALTSWEIATELSYLFWQTTPDGELLDLAASDVLQDPQAVAEQVDRLLQDERAADVMVEMGQQWLGLKGLGFVARDTELYPELTTEVRTAMSIESNMVLSNTFEQNGTLSDLLLNQTTYLDQTLATYYDLSIAASSNFAPVDLSSETRFGGLLGQGALMTVHALPTSSSPIHRGMLVRERFLCQELPPPPANLDTSPPSVDPTLSTRERYAQHSSDPACSGCHELIDPIGFGFEHYDGIGRWRAMDGSHDIDATGEILNTLETNGTFDGVQGLSEHLAASSEVSACYVQQWFIFGTGVGDMEEPEASCGVDAAVEIFTVDGGTLQSAPKALALLDRMYSRSGEVGEMDTLARGEQVIDEPDDTGDVEDTGGPVEPVEDIMVDVVENSNWGTGYCNSVTVTNTGTVETTWMIELPIVDTITSLWSANSIVVSGGIQFTGVDWNATLQPAQSTEFGFCASL